MVPPLKVRRFIGPRLQAGSSRTRPFSSALLHGLCLEHAAADPILLDRLEQGLQVALAEALMDGDGERLVSGTQVARLINVGLYLRKTDADAPKSSRLIIPAPNVPPCPGNDGSVQAFRELWQEFSQQADPLQALAARMRNS